MARAIAKTMAVPRRLSLGCQRQSLYFPRPRAKKGRWANARISNELPAASQGRAARLSIADHTARFHAASIVGKLGGFTRSDVAALSTPAALLPAVILVHSSIPNRDNRST